MYAGTIYCSTVSIQLYCTDFQSKLILNQDNDGEEERIIYSDLIKLEFKNVS